MEASDALDVGSIPAGCIIMKVMKEFIQKHFRFLVPAVVVVLSAIAVVVALNIRGNTESKEQSGQGEEVVQETVEEIVPLEELEIPLVVNSNTEIQELFDLYYQCLSDGDMETLQTLCDTVSEKDLLTYEEQSKYLEYEITEIYTQEGPVPDSYIVYVCCEGTFIEYEDLPLPLYDGFYVKLSDETGKYMICNGVLTQEESEYLSVANSKDDILELNNRITVEYNDKVSSQPEVLVYMKELDQTVRTARGERTAELNGSTSGNEEKSEEENEEESTEEAQPFTAIALTTVNVRASDSENADRLGMVNGGTELTVLENQVNGWAKIEFEGKEGYIKVEFLVIPEKVEDVEVIGTITTTDDLNIRLGPTSESSRLGMVSKGTTLNYVGEEDGWYKVIYNDQVAYVSSDYAKVNE